MMSRIMVIMNTTRRRRRRVRRMRRTSMTRRGRRRRAESTAYITIKKKKIKEEEITTTTNNSNKTCSDLGAGRDGHDGHRLVVPDSLVNARRLTQVTAPGAAPTIKEAANDEDDDNGYSRSATQRAQQHCRHHVGSETPPRTARRIIFMMNADQMKCGLRSDKLCLLMKADVHDTPTAQAQGAFSTPCRFIEEQHIINEH